MKKLILLSILLLSLVAGGLNAQNRVTTYQGNIIDAISNQPMTGTVQMTFELYTTQLGGSQLWSEIQNVTLEKGYFNVYLGSVNPFPANLDLGKQLWLQITVGNGSSYPRTPLTPSFSSMYADKAAIAGLADDIKDGIVTLEKLAEDAKNMGGDLTGTLPNPKIRKGAFLEAIEPGSITQEMLSPNVSTRPSGPASGDLTGWYPDPLIAPMAVKTDRIDDLAVTNEKIGNNAVTAEKIAPLSIYNAHITDNAVETRNIMNAAVTTDKINDLAVTTAKINDLAVTTAKIADDAVTQDKLDPNVSAFPWGPAGGDLMGTYPNPGVDALYGVSLASAALLNGDVYMYNAVSNAWESTQAGGDIVGDYNDITVTHLLNIPMSAQPIDPGQIYMFDGISWIPAGSGGDVSGLYNNLQLNPDVVTTIELAPDAVITENILDLNVTNAKLAADAVTTDKIADGNVMTADIANGAIYDNHINALAAIQGVKVVPNFGAQNIITTGNVTATNGLFTNATISGITEVQGSITNSTGAVTVDDDLTVTGTLTTPAFSTTSITATNAAFTNLTVTNPIVGSMTGVLTDGAGVAGFTYDGSGNATVAVNIDGATIGIDGTDNLYLVDNAVTTAKITDLNVTNAKLSADAVTTDKILNSTILTEDIAAGQITNALMAANSVNSANIIDGEINTVDIANQAVTTNKIDNLAVTTNKIDNSAVTTAKIANFNVTNEKLSADAVTSDKILDGTIATADIANLAITNALLAANAVSNDKVQALAITNDKISSAVSGVNEPAGNILKADGAGNVIWSDELFLFPYSQEFDGNGDMLTLTRTGGIGRVYAGEITAAGMGTIFSGINNGIGSVAYFENSFAGNDSPTLHLLSNSTGAFGWALYADRNTANFGDYTANIVNSNAGAGGALVLTNNAAGFDVTPSDWTDNNDGTNGAPTLEVVNLAHNTVGLSHEAVAIRTYGDIEANSAIRGTDLIGLSSVIVGNPYETMYAAPILAPFAGSDNLNIAYNTRVWGDLTVDNDGFFGNDVNVTNTLNAMNVNATNGSFTDLDVTNNLTSLNAEIGTLTVNGVSYLRGDIINDNGALPVAINDDLDVYGNAYATGDLTVDGNVYANMAGSLAFFDNVDVAANLDVWGMLTATDGLIVNDFVVGNDLEVGNDLTVTNLATVEDLVVVGGATIATGNLNIITGKATSAATLAGDAANTLTTKGYVDAADAAINVLNEPFITYQASAKLTNERVLSGGNGMNFDAATATMNIDNDATLAVTATQIGLNLANANTWTGTQTFGAAGNSLVVSNNAQFNGSVRYTPVTLNGAATRANLATEITNGKTVVIYSTSVPAERNITSGSGLPVLAAADAGRVIYLVNGDAAATLVVLGKNVQTTEAIALLWTGSAWVKFADGF